MRKAATPRGPDRPRWRYYVVEVFDHWHYIAFGILIGALTFWWWMRPENTYDAAGAAACRQMYALARTATDTVRVDATYPFGPGRQDTMTCGRMRALGRLD